MTLIDENDYESFCKNKLCQGLGSSELKALYGITRQIPLEAGAVLLSEGQKGSELFFILKGTLEVIKKDSATGHSYVLDTIGPGEGAGEISFIDRGARSASVKAKTKSIVRAISFTALEEQMNTSVKFSHIFIHLLKNISQRLRVASNTTLNALKKEVRENKARIQLGNLLVYIIMLLTLYTYSLSPLQYLFTIVTNTAYVTMPVTFVIVGSVFLLIRVSNLSWDQFGVSLTNWKQATFDGLVLPIPFLLGGVLFKWLLTQHHSNYIGHPIIEPFTMFLDPETHNWSSWFQMAAVYWFFVVPIQELLTRGALQGLFEHFLLTKHKVFISILLSNLIFSTTHLFFSPFISSLVFLGGLYIGWVYSRTHNLISSCLAHGILGTWLLFFMGVSISANGG